MRQRSDESARAHESLSGTAITLQLTAAELESLKKLARRNGRSVAQELAAIAADGIAADRSRIKRLWFALRKGGGS